MTKNKIFSIGSDLFSLSPTKTLDFLAPESPEAVDFLNATDRQLLSLSYYDNTDKELPCYQHTDSKEYPVYVASGVNLPEEVLHFCGAYREMIKLLEAHYFKPLAALLLEAEFMAPYENLIAYRLKDDMEAIFFSMIYSVFKDNKQNVYEKLVTSKEKDAEDILSAICFFTLKVLGPEWKDKKFDDANKDFVTYLRTHEMTYDIVGMHYHHDAFKRLDEYKTKLDQIMLETIIKEGRKLDGSEIMHKLVTPAVIRERENPYDKNAVALKLNCFTDESFTLGYLSRVYAELYAKNNIEGEWRVDRIYTSEKATITFVPASR